MSGTVPEHLKVTERDEYTFVPPIYSQDDEDLIDGFVHVFVCSGRVHVKAYVHHPEPDSDGAVSLTAEQAGRLVEQLRLLTDRAGGFVSGRDSGQGDTT